MTIKPNGNKRMKTEASKLFWRSTKTKRIAWSLMIHLLRRKRTAYPLISIIWSILGRPIKRRTKMIRPLTIGTWWMIDPL